MFFKRREELNVDKFWSDYEISIGEKVLAKSLGQYLSGLSEYPHPLWGLAMATSGGFRFHHFPHEGWIVALSRITTGGEPPKERTFFIPNNDISSVELIMEKHWWKKILTPSNPVLMIRCRVNGEESQVAIETDKSADAIVNALR
jgi:hypothetical protein